MSILVPLDRIVDNPFQTRQSYDEERIAEVADSIVRDGLIAAPIGRVVNQDGAPVAPASVIKDGSWLPPRGVDYVVQIAVGHNRLRAFRLLHQQKRLPSQYQLVRGSGYIPVEIRLLDDEQMDMLAWTENHQRKDLTPIEEACAIRDRIERRGWTQEKAAVHLGLARPTVANKLRLLKLPEDLLQAVATGQLSERQALELLPAVTLSEEDRAALKRTYTFYTPERIRSQALAGASSTTIRDEVKQLKKAIKFQRQRDEREAEARRQVEAAVVKAAEEGTELIDVRDLKSNQYDEVSDDPKSYRYVPGCSAECECRKKAIGHSGAIVDVCTNPGRRNALKGKKTRDRKKERRQERTKRLEKLEKKLIRDGRVVWTPQAISLIVKHVFMHHSISVDDIRAAAAALGLPKTIAEIGRYSNEAAEAEKLLRSLSMDTALLFALQAIIQKDLREWIEFEGHKTENYNLVMRGVPYSAPEDSAAGGDGTAGGTEQLELEAVPLADEATS